MRFNLRDFPPRFIVKFQAELNISFNQIVWTKWKIHNASDLEWNIFAKTVIELELTMHDVKRININKCLKWQEVEATDAFSAKLQVTRFSNYLHWIVDCLYPQSKWKRTIFDAFVGSMSAIWFTTLRASRDKLYIILNGKIHHFENCSSSRIVNNMWSTLKSKRKKKLNKQ